LFPRATFSKIWLAVVGASAPATDREHTLAHGRGRASPARLVNRLGTCPAPNPTLLTVAGWKVSQDAEDVADASQRGGRIRSIRGIGNAVGSPQVVNVNGGWN